MVSLFQFKDNVYGYRVGCSRLNQVKQVLSSARTRERERERERERPEGDIKSEVTAKLVVQGLTHK